MAGLHDTLLPPTALKRDRGLDRSLRAALDASGRDNPLHRLLAGRSNATSDALWLGLRHLFRVYLAPENLRYFARTCPLAGIRPPGPDDMAGYGAARSMVLREMARGLSIGPEDPRLSAALTLATGAIMVASAVPADEVATILTPAAERVDRILAGLGGGQAVFRTSLRMNSRV